jgi:VWFA-related protein
MSARQPFRLATCALVFFSGLSLAVAYGQPEATYHIDREQIEKDGRLTDRVYVVRRPDARGKQTLFVTVRFKITRPDGQPANDVLPGEFVVTEDGRRVSDLEVHSPTASEPLTTVLAIDISGSMAEHGKIDEARKAAQLFLDRLDPRAACGLILFDHELRVREQPTTNRDRLRRLIDQAQPGGGTAYLDATADALAMLRPVKGRRAVLLLTDGVDLNSRHTAQDVVGSARGSEVPVYTIGVGEPGKNIAVTTVLVLDCSGSMDEPADNTDQVSKMEALHQAAGRFVDIMRPGARTSLLPFSNTVPSPPAFTADKLALKRMIRQLEASGETALFDAAYKAVTTLDRAHPEGKRAVVVLTDGRDNRSRHSAADAIRAARQAEIPLHMLGLGRDGELDEEVMQRMAGETGGTYHHARNKQTLYEIFENLSIQLHDDGVDESALNQLADQTGGKYFPAQDISRLSFIYEGLAEELQTTYTVTFPSLRQEDDGTARDVAIGVWRNGLEVSNVLRDGYNRPGVVVPEMKPGVYLALLAVVGVLVALPAGLRRFVRRDSNLEQG